MNYGNFTLTCPTCGALGSGPGSIFAAFTFNLVITDQTDGASATFVGSSPGGLVFTNVSTLVLTWSPSQLGPGGGFNSTDFTITPFTLIVNPGSGAQIGSTTLQGGVNSPSATPEPATLGLVGASLIGLGLVRRKKVIA